MGLTPSQTQLLEAAKLTALELGDHGKSLTGLIGVLSACEYLDLEWRPTDLHNAISPSGERVRIRTRRSLEAQHLDRSGKMRKFGGRSGYDFDLGVFAELNWDYEIVQVWARHAKSIKALESTENRPIRIRTFTSGAASPGRVVDVETSLDHENAVWGNA